MILPITLALLIVACAVTLLARVKKKTSNRRQAERAFREYNRQREQMVKF